jgi:hypothetical protein
MDISVIYEGKGATKLPLSNHDPTDVEGIDFIQFLAFMKQMKYTAEPNELLVQAWKNISHFNTGGIKKGEIISLRNLIIFLIGIENIFIKSMGLQDDLPFDGKDRKREHRQFGFFIGCNFFLADATETRKMCEVYRPLVLNKK